MADGVYCKCCKAFVGYLTIAQAEVTYGLAGCPYCSRCTGDKADQAKADYGKNFVTGKTSADRWTFGEGP